MGVKRLDHVSELLSPYVDGQVTPDERSAVEGHLATCVACSAELASLRALKRLLADLPASPPPRSFALGPRRLRPAALSGTPAGFARAATSIAAALAVLAIAGSLALQGLPRTSSRAASAPVPAASIEAIATAQPLSRDTAPQTAAAPAQAGSPASAAAKGSAAREPGVAGFAPPSTAQKPAAPEAAAVQPGSPAQGGDSGATAAARGNAGPAVTTRPAAEPLPVNVPRLAGELLVLLACLGVVVYSVRWWRR